MRIAAVSLLGLAVSFGGTSPATAKKPKKQSACQKLNKRYKDKDLSRNPKLLTVERGNPESGRVSACILPRGKIRTLVSWEDGLGRESGGVVDTAGTWVLVVRSYADQYGGANRSLTRVNVRPDRRLGLSSYSCYFDDCDTGSSDFGEAGVAPSGAGAYELIEGGATTLQAFDPAGRSTKLADGAVEKLRVTSKQISWTQAGVAHSTPLPS